MRHARVLGLAGLAIAAVGAVAFAQTTVAPLPDNAPVETAPLEIDLSKSTWGDATAGQAKASACAACHGADGKGNTTMGAPNLTDRIWLHGWGEQAIVSIINNGKTNVMPAHADKLTEPQIHVLAAYVWGLSRNTTAQSR